MSCVWQLQEAKSKFSEVVETALKYGPQVITKRGADTAVVLSYMEYRQLTLSNGKVSDSFRESPLSGADLDLTRDGSRLREDPSL